MPGTGILVGSLVASDPVTNGRVALIAGTGPRERIVEILRSEKLGFNTFDDPDALFERAPKRSPALIVQWVEDPSSGLLGLIEPLTQSFAQTAIVVVCSTIERWDVRTALAAGVTGVVIAESLDSTLAPCLRAVLSGQICVPRAHWRQIEPPALSSREKQILGLVVMGFMNSQIAERLVLAESTVKSHLSSAFGKLGVRSRNEAVKLILDPDRGLGMGILALGGDPVKPKPATLP